MDGLIEPYLIKAISLLHSSAKDSGDLLKAMLDDAIRQKNETTGGGNTSSSGISKGLPPPLSNAIKNKDVKKVKMETFIDEDVPLSKRRKESPKSSQPSSPATSVSERGKEIKKKQDVADDDAVMAAKKFKDSPRSSLPPSPAGSSHNSRSTSPTGGARRSDDMESINDADDLAQEIMEDLNCVVCHGMDFSTGNQMVECQECHNLYHQECHKPVISDAEVNDPRSVFTCSDCKPLSRNATSGGTKAIAGISPSSSNISRPKSSSPVFFVKSRSDSPSSGLAGKNITLVTGLNNKQTTIKVGASSNKSGGSSSSSSSSSSNSGGGTNNPALMNADKRLQNIKKRAATKLQEKRKPGGK